MDAAAFNTGIAAKKPGDRVRLAVTRAGKVLEIETTLGHKDAKELPDHPGRAPRRTADRHPHRLDESQIED